MRRRIYESEHEHFRDSVQQFIKRSVAPFTDDYAVSRAIPRRFWLDAGRQGLLGLQVPTLYGGQGADDYRFTAVVTEELAKVNAALASGWSIHADIAAPYIVALAPESRRQAWLPGIVSGEILLAIGMTEPSGGSDLAAIKTSAMRDGDHWIINGSKTFITNGSSADLVLVAARTDPGSKARGISLFAVEAATAGFSRGRKLDKVGQDEADTAELFFHDVRVSGDHLVGDLNVGFIHMMTNLPQERLGGALANIAHAKQILIETLQYAKDRLAFGAAIGSFQHNKFLLAELFTQIEVAEAYLDRCVLEHCAGKLSVVDAAKAKWWSSQTQNEVLDHCVQIYGGYGYMNEYRVARAWRDARVTKIWAGTNEVMKELIGRDLGL